MTDPDIEALLGPLPEGPVDRHKNLGPLHDLLLKACPPDEHGRRSIPVLARHLNMTSWGIFKWIKASHIPPKQAARIVTLSEGRVSLEDFTPFVFH